MSRDKKDIIDLFIPKRFKEKSEEVKKIKKGEEKTYSPSGGNLDNPPQSGSGVPLPPKPPKDEDKKDA